MSLTLLLLVLLAAAMHASWNALVKSGGDQFVTQTLVIFTPTLFSGPLLLWLPPMAADAWPFLLLSVVLHLLYYMVLVGAYRHGDLSQVYPIARGSAPSLVALGGWILAGESKAPLELLGVLIVSLGIISLAWRGRGLPRDGERRAIAYALATGLTIAAYSLCDGLGGRAALETPTYIAWLFFLEGPPLLALALWRRRGRIVASFRGQLLRGFLGGTVAGIAYAIVIWAMSQAPMAHVVALRETSVLLAAVIGVLLLKEPFGRRRIAAAGVVASGAALLQLAG